MANVDKKSKISGIAYLNDALYGTEMFGFKLNV